jgi:hypothetical protein
MSAYGSIAATLGNPHRAFQSACQAPLVSILARAWSIGNTLEQSASHSAALVPVAGILAVIVWISRLCLYENSFELAGRYVVSCGKKHGPMGG